MELGEGIRRRRDAEGLTLEVLAERSGLTANYIGGIEAGKRDPSLSTMISLARALGVPTGDLLGGVQALSPAAIEAGRLYETYPPEVQEALIRLIRTILKPRR